MILADIKQELYSTITFSNDLFRTRILLRANKTNDLSASEERLRQLQDKCDDFCTAMANVIKECDLS